MNLRQLARDLKRQGVSPEAEELKALILRAAELLRQEIERVTKS